MSRSDSADKVKTPSIQLNFRLAMSGWLDFGDPEATANAFQEKAHTTVNKIAMRQRKRLKTSDNVKYRTDIGLPPSEYAFRAPNSLIEILYNLLQSISSKWNYCLKTTRSRTFVVSIRRHRPRGGCEGRQ